MSGVNKLALVAGEGWLASASSCRRGRRGVAGVRLPAATAPGCVLRQLWGQRRRHSAAATEGACMPGQKLGSGPLCHLLSVS